MKKETYQLEVNGHDVELSNLDKIFWPKEKYTKGDLLVYYQEVSSYILPYLKNRPVVLHRFPNGIVDKGFFQKDILKLDPPTWIKTTPVKHEDKVVVYLVIQDEAALLYAINTGGFELHPFLSQIDSLEYPDYISLDLDPKEISFEYVIETAQVIHEILSSAKIKCYCKTSGKKGLHIHIPLGQQFTYSEAKKIAQNIALSANEVLPKTTTVTRSASTKKKVYIDFLRNIKGQTVVAPYSVRPAPFATVSTPLEWDEVKKGLDPQEFTIKTILKRLKKIGDIFKPTLGKGSANLKKLL